MVLLTMTPTMVAAIKDYLSVVQAGEGPCLEMVEGEPSLENPTAGNPISYGQAIAIYKLISRHKPALQVVLKDQTDSSEESTFSLSNLLRGSQVYIPPAEQKAGPMDKYKALMKDLRRQEEESAYERMTQRSSGSSRPPPTSSFTPASADDDAEITYADVNRQMALIINVLVSVVACSFAIWMASGHWSTPRRLALSMAGSGLVAIAEVVVYAGYLSRVKNAKERGKRRVETKEIMNSWVIGGEKND